MVNKAKLNYWIDFLLAISFFVVSITGIFKWPGLISTFSAVYEVIPRLIMARIHDLSGAIMAVLVLVHLVLHWTWIKAMTKQIFGRKE